MDGLVVEVVSEDALPRCAVVMREAFSTVARARGFTTENAPTHPSLTTEDDVRRLSSLGTRFFGIITQDAQMLGCVALTMSDRPGICYLERLAVLPSERHRGLGRRLVDHVAEEAQRMGARELSIGIIDDDVVLKSWYEMLGFRTTGRRQFEHLPFTVCYMARDVTVVGQSGETGSCRNGASSCCRITPKA